MPIVILLLLADMLLAVTGQLLLKKGMLVLGPIDFSLANIPVLIFGIMKNFYIITALFCYGIGFIFWLFILSKIKLSIAYPSTALVYVLIILGSWIFFHEHITPYQGIGIALVLAGLFFLFESI